MRPELPPPPLPDPATLARAQARLLAGLSQLGLETLGSEAPGPAPEPAPPATREPKRSEPVSERYRFGPVFARGGLGAVRRAEDLKLGRTVAVKELLRFDERSVDRFVREAAITSRLQHPGIVPLYDLGRADDGRPFLCMKLVEGASLEQRIAGCAEVQARLGLVQHVIAAAEAMAYAHRQGVIHRDLKPANILVGEFGEAVVIDWGLAKYLSQETETLPTTDPEDFAVSDLTAEGSLLGTVRYMPPEQARGDGVDARSDIYALGAVLYHVIAGVPPFHDRRAAQLLHDVLAGEPRPLARLVPEAPPALIAVVEKAMAKQPGRRYADAEAFADDLRRYQAGRLVGAHAYSLTEVGRLWLRRHRAAVSVAAASVAALAAIGVVAVGRIREARDVAEEQRAAAESAQEVAEVRASEAEAARVTADRRADELVLTQARLAIEADPSQVVPLLAQLRPDPARDGAVRALALAAWQPGMVGPALTGPTDALIDGVNLADGTWIGVGLDALWRWRPGAVEAEKLGGGGRLAVTPDRTHWAYVSAEDGKHFTAAVYGPDGGVLRTFAGETEKPVTFYHWALSPDGASLWAWPMLAVPALEFSVATGARRELAGADAPAAVRGLSLHGTLDGRRLAGVRGDTLVVWDRETGVVDVSRHPCQPRLYTGEWTPDGRALVVPCAEAQRASGMSGIGHQLVWQVDGPSRVVEAAWSAPGRDALVFIAHRDGWTSAWAESPAGDRLWTRAVRTDRSDDFVVAPHTSRDGALVEWGFGVTIDVLEVASGTSIVAGAGLDGAILGDGELLLAGPDGHRRVRPQDAAWQSLWPAPREPLPQAQLAEGGGWAVQVGKQGPARLDLRTGATEAVGAACGWWPDRAFLRAVADDGRVLVDLDNGTACLWGHGRGDIFEVPRHPWTDVAFTAGRFAIGFADGEVREWTSPGSPSRRLPLRDHLFGLRYSPDGEVLAALAHDGGVMVVERDGAARLAVEPVTEEGSGHTSLAFAPAGATLAVYRRGQPEIEVVDLQQDARWQLAGATRSPTSGSYVVLRFSPSGQRFAVIDGDLLQAWALAQPEAPLRAQGSSRWTDFAFMDEQTVALAAIDGRVDVVDLGTGLVAPMRAPTGGRVRSQLAAVDGGLALLAGTGEVLRFTDRLPAAGAPLQAWLREAGGGARH
ncbi:WD40 repeat domain-containing serine/threonine protein kinase [Nannocystis bainbridge]|uniref:WD40 repeat domain-containing serine/threonine protein kinase n=1 Tax=Nannocystis bainbridge TaxID=2995303 RepID=A0ABT5DTL8_9BACT|nr:WD40 repeat domain-containing serine/threonine protein kinase [Nannocystis bainbridge]MDC0716993.1 WD40 repeat domain-containing serine/threonine protein kinase [Nannocystis bainbridge]